MKIQHRAFRLFLKFLKNFPELIGFISRKRSRKLRLPKNKTYRNILMERQITQRIRFFFFSEQIFFFFLSVSVVYLMIQGSSCHWQFFLPFKPFFSGLFANRRNNSHGFGYWVGPRVGISNCQPHQTDNSSTQHFCVAKYIKKKKKGHTNGVVQRLRGSCPPSYHMLANSGRCQQ